MSTYSIGIKYPTKKACIDKLEQLRWGNTPVCPYCGSTNTVAIKKELRHHCNNIPCKRSFSVLIGTIFEDTHLPLPKFFVLIALMLDARKGVSAMQLSRNLDIKYQTAWYAAMRVRCAMVETITDLSGMVEADEVYIGGKPRKRNNAATSNSDAIYSQITTNPQEITKRGRGTKKIPVVGFVERDGRVVTKMTEQLRSRDLLAMLKRYVNEDEAVVVTDEYRGYNHFDQDVEHLVVKHSSKEYVRGIAHTNTIEGFWSLIKNGLRGQYHVLSKKYLPFYLAEFAYKYNRRNAQGIQFEAFLKDAMSEGKCLQYYKPVADVKSIVYPRKIKPDKAEVDAFMKANKLAAQKRKEKKKQQQATPKKRKYLMF